MYTELKTPPFLVFLRQFFSPKVARRMRKFSLFWKEFLAKTTRRCILLRIFPAARNRRDYFGTVEREKRQQQHLFVLFLFVLFSFLLEKNNN